MNCKRLDEQYIAGTYSRFDAVFTCGSGSVIYDDKGKRYIDMGSGIAVNSFGIADAKWRRAVTAQMKRIQHASNLYYTLPQTLLAEELCRRTGMKKVFFSNSGAEANECAIKTARKYSHDKYGENRHTIITLKNSFHGRTLTTLSATGQDMFHRDFGPFTEGFVYAEPNDIADITRLLNSYSCCAVMLEIIQGEGGINMLDAGYLAQVAALCKKRDVLLIVDEVQTGCGRTGKLFAYMLHGLKPDIVTTAKGLGGGLPIGATLLGDSVEDVLTPSSHGSTFGGNPVCAAGALTVIRRIDDKLLETVTEKSEYICAELSHVKNVTGVSGCGLMLGIQTVKPAGALAASLLKRGVAVLTAKNKLRLLPALNIPMPLLKNAVAVIADEIEA